MSLWEYVRVIVEEERMDEFPGAGVPGRCARIVTQDLHPLKQVVLKTDLPFYPYKEGVYYVSIPTL